jgi:hypothetical protein
MNKTAAVNGLVLGLLVLLAGAGAARGDGSIVLGRPGVTAIALAITAAAFAFYRGLDRWVVAGLLVAPLLILLVPRSAAAGVSSGPPLYALAAAAIFVLGPPWRRLRPFFFPVVLAVYVAFSLGVQRTVGPQGDEPHYLMVAESLLHDHDLSLEKDYQEGRYHAFFKGDSLAPHFRVRGRHGEIYSLHAVGLSLLILPAYAIGGYPAASLFMAVLAAAAAEAIRRLLRAAVDEGEADTAEAIAWVVALSPPLLHFAGLVFTEVPAALVVAWALREGLRAAEIPTARAWAVAAAIASLPWLNVRYGIVAVLLWAFWIWLRPRGAVVVAHVTAAVVSAGALMAYHFVLYGFFDPRRVYGRQREFSFETLRWGAPGLLLDQEFGLLIYAPVFVLALPGLVRLARRHQKLAIAGCLLVGIVFLTAAAWPMWRGGFNPPARFLVPIVPVLAVGVAAWVGERRSAATALLVGWGFFTGLGAVANPSLVHRDRDGTAPFFRAESGATEWTRLLPRYVLFEPDRHRLAAIWASLLLIAVLRSRKEARPASLAIGVLLLAAAAEMAARASIARAGGREAVHVLRPGASATWTTSDLTWGPVYEPHRHSGQAAIGERLGLAAGLYRLRLVGTTLGGAGVAPSLRLIGREGRPMGLSACADEETGWICAFAVPAGTPEVSLVLEGGSTFEIKQIRLAFNPEDGPAV